MSTCAVNVTENTGPDGKARPRVRRSYAAASLPDKKGRLIEMTQHHRLVLLCLLSHIDDIEGDSSFTYVTVGTIAKWAGVGNTKAEGLIIQLRAVGMIARRQRAATSTVTTVYRNAGNWEQQAVDEAPESLLPTEESKPAPKVEEPMPVKLTKPTPKPEASDDISHWVAKARTWLKSSAVAKCFVAQLDCPKTLRLVSSQKDVYASKEAADQTIVKLKDVLVDTGRVARAVMPEDRWFVVALLRPEIIASLALTQHYNGVVDVHRLPKIAAVDEFSSSCTMIRLFQEGSMLNQRCIPLFHDRIEKHAAWLVRNYPQIVRIDASLSKGFPFSISGHQMSDPGEECQERRSAEEPDRDDAGDAELDGEEGNHEESHWHPFDDAEPVYDARGGIKDRYPD